MSNEELEIYVALVAKFMRLSPEERDLISGELQDHLQLRVEDLIHDGVSRSDAISQAVHEFGDAAVMAKNFQTVHNLKRRRWMMRFMTFSIVGSFLITILAIAMWPQNARFGSPSKSIAQEDNTPEAPLDAVKSVSPKVRLNASDSTQRNRKAESALKQAVNLGFYETPFDEVKEELEDITGLNFILTQSARDDSLTDDELTTFTVTQMPLGDALELILASHNATYFIDSGAVQIISVDDADDEAYLRVKMFDCRELAKVLTKTSPPQRIRSNSGGFGGGTFSVCQIPASQHLPTQQVQPQQSNQLSESQLLDAKLQQIMSMMQQEANRRLPEPTAEHTLETLVRTIAGPDTWISEGSGLGTVKAVNGILIVRNTETILKQVENLIVDLKSELISK